MIRTIITRNTIADNNAKNVDVRDSSLICVRKISQKNSHSFNDRL